MKKKKPKKIKIIYENMYDSLSPEEKQRADYNIERAFDMIFTEAFDNLAKKKSFPDLSRDLTKPEQKA